MDKRNGIEANAEECEEMKLRALLTDGARMGEMYFRPGKKADLADPKAYLLARGFLVARNRNSPKLA